MDIYQQFIHKSRYARWIPELNRRETWEETVDRYIEFITGQCNKLNPDNKIDFQEIRQAILGLEVMPSMRALMTAGPAALRENLCTYNCSAIAIDSIRSFDEIMYILMCGTGVGYSVESQFVSKLPEVAETFHDTDSVIVVGDSKKGWSSAYRELVALLYAGKVPSWDVSKVRPEGAPLKIFGGRASGPGVLVKLFEYTVQMFKKAAGRKLTSLECSDLVCQIASVIMVGGQRRAALICLSDLSDYRMRDSKSGNWWETEVQRGLANISAVYETKPEISIFMDEWKALMMSGSGERGIFNRQAIKKTSPIRRKTENITFLVNPCAEINLRPMGLCNLTEVVIRSNDTKETLEKKVRIASIIGTIQSSLTDFDYVRSTWKKNAEEERLLGVSMTGIVSRQWDAQELQSLKQLAINTNIDTAADLKINESVAVTTVKPSGNVSQLVDSASGIHPIYSEYYIRTVRNAVTDPVSDLMIEAGVPYELDVTNSSTYVFSFPKKGFGTTRHQMNALDQLELYKLFKQNWVEHNVSITVYVGTDEWLKVGAWVYENFDLIGGVSFLPRFDSEHTYQQAPYQEITKEQFDEISDGFPTEVDWLRLTEVSDKTTGAQELACSSGQCELI